MALICTSSMLLTPSLLGWGVHSHKATLNVFNPFTAEAWLSFAHHQYFILNLVYACLSLLNSEVQKLCGEPRHTRTDLFQSKYFHICSCVDLYHNPKGLVCQVAVQPGVEAFLRSLLRAWKRDQVEFVRCHAQGNTVLSAPFT